MKAEHNDIRYNLKEILLYLVFGALTTAVSISLYWLFTRLFMVGYIGANILSWIGAVTFAYITNKRVVFSDKGAPIKKAIAFYLSRVFTLIVEIVVMYVMIEWLLINDMITKVAVQVIVVVLNYIVSKFIVFRKE